MIQANELRIGNFAKGYDNNIICVDAISEEKIRFKNRNGTFYINKEDLYPIPLMPEIFETFGFTSKGKYFTNGILTLYPYGNGSYGIEVDGFTDQGINTSVTYLNALQNIYFCLRGEELKLKDDINTIDFGNGFVVGL